MAKAAVAADLHQALDVHGDLAAQIALHLQVMVDVIAQGADLVFGKILDARIGVDAGRGDDLVRGRAADAVDIGQGDLNAFFPGKVYACDSCHRFNAPPNWLASWSAGKARRCPRVWRHARRGNIERPPKPAKRAAASEADLSVASGAWPGHGASPRPKKAGRRPLSPASACAWGSRR